MKIHLDPWGQLLPKPERQWVLARTFRGNPVFCFLTVNVLLLSLFSPLQALYPRCLQTLMNRSLIFLSKSSILHLTIEYLYVPGSNKRFLALILLPDENGVTTGNTWISQQYSMSIIQKWTHFSPSTLSLPSISCLRPAWRLDTWRPFILCAHLYFMHAAQKGSLIILLRISSMCLLRSAVSSTVPTIPSYLMPTLHIVVILLKTQKCLLPTLQWTLFPL